MDIPVIVLLVGLLIFGSFFFNRIFSRLKIPSALFFIIVGVILGFYIDPDLYLGDVGGAFAALTLNVIIYHVGKRFNFKNIKTVPTRALPFTLLNVFFAIVLIAGAARFIGKMDWTASLFLAFILSGTSSVIIVPIAQSLKLKDKSRKTLVYESVFTDIICIVGGLIFFEYIIHGANTTTGVSGKVAESVLFGLLSGVIAGVLWVLVLISMKRVTHTMFASLAFILIIFGASTLIGFNGGFAVLAFGIMAGNIDHNMFRKWFTPVMTEKAKEYTSNEKYFFEEIILLIQTYFFVYMGMMLEYYSTLVFLIALVLMVILVLLRWVSVRAFASRGIDYKERIIMSVLLPKGIIPAVMATFAFEMGLNGGLEIMQYAYAIIIISLFVSSVLIAIARKDPEYFGRVKDKMLSHNKTDKDVDNNSSEEN
ncbi:MAG: cation:proton antiporter [Bacteroidales bacterium]|jgi:cell volume regulation protein A|nr:cation:proton antiporter [Bacteroidales bacterium]